MKLSMINEDSSRKTEIIRDHIRSYILSGESRIKEPLTNGEITIKDIAEAIRNERCLGTEARDLGTTYLEQIIGTAIRGLPIDLINPARKLFGLEELTKKELIKIQNQ